MIALLLLTLFIGRCTEYPDRTECDCATGSSSCRRKDVNCVNDKPCEVTCRSQQSSCLDAKINCPEWGSCTINCDKCRDVIINCPSNSVTQKCVVNCEECKNVHINPPSLAKLICYSNSSTSCDAATINNTYPSTSSKSCNSTPPSTGLLNATAFGYCVVPTLHGFTCEDSCSGTHYTCIDGEWNPSTTANCDIPTDCIAKSVSFTEIESNKVCLSYDLPLKSSPSVEECLTQCLDETSCLYFSYNSHSRNCLWEHSQFKCSEGTVNDVPLNGSNTSTSVFQVRDASPACSGHGYCTSAGCICYKSAENGFWDGISCDKCSPGYATATCKVPCNGGACNPCTGHGWCSDGVNGDGSCKCGDNWNGISCSECSQNNFGSDCRGKCPIGTIIAVTCSNRGECNNGITGDGKCTCQDGWQPPLCDACTPNHWGFDCSQDCPGAGNCSGHGTCDPVNGTCSCNPTFTGSDCNVSCDCNGHGVCSSSDQLCKCDGNFAGSDCTDCIPGYGDPLCTTPCQGTPDNVCNGHGVCTTVGLTAECTCDKNWFNNNNKFCSRSCPIGRDKKICSGHGRCSGRRLRSCVCNKEWEGLACGSCSSKYSGVDCSKPCPSNRNTTDVCSNRGTCFDGGCHCDDSCGVACEIDSLLCDQLCSQSGLFMQNCTGECPGFDSTQTKQILCSGHGYCDDGKKGSGLCKCDINKGWGGVACNQQCPTASNKYTCSGNGLCTPINNGQNVSCVCSPGFAGFDCNLRCPTTRDGICSSNGECTDTGSCECHSEWGGPDCSVFCGCLAGRGICNSNLTCECTAAFNGSTCESCSNGLHGIDCNKTCHNGISTNGECHCLPNWSGLDCDKPCPTDISGRYICNGNGICVSGSDRQISTCVCNNGWYGEACTHQCNDIVCGNQYPYGHGICNKLTGACECSSHYKGLQCDECADGYWGSKCDIKCPCNPTGGYCESTTGECVCYNDISTGYHTGKTCNECHPDWTGLPMCKTPSIPITHHSTISTLVSQRMTDMHNSKLLLISDNTSLGYVGGDPIVLYNMTAQRVAGIALLNSCPILKGWEWNGIVYLLSQKCVQYGSSKILRIKNPPMNDSDWDGRGVGPPPACTPLTQEVCVLTELNTDLTPVLDANWYSSESPIVLLLTSTNIHYVWVDVTWGISISIEVMKSVPSPLPVVYSPLKISSVNGTIYFVCGLVNVSPAWFCSSFILNMTSHSLQNFGNNLVKGVSMFQWDKRLSPTGGTPVPIMTQITSLLGTETEFIIICGTTNPSKTDTMILRYRQQCSDCLPVLESNSVIPLINYHSEISYNNLAYDKEERSAYGVASHVNRMGSLSSFLFKIDLIISSVKSLIWIPDTTLESLTVDMPRRLIYAVGQHVNSTGEMSLFVYSALCVTDLEPKVILRDIYRTELMISGFGFKDVSDSETPPKCYFSSLATTVTTTAVVDSKSNVRCKAPHTQDLSLCALSGFVDISVFDPVGEVLPYISRCKVSYLHVAHPVVHSVEPSVSPLDSLKSVIVVGNGFQSQSDLKCKYRSPTVGDFTVSAVLLNATAVSCLQPPLVQPVSDMFVSISADGQSFSSELQVSFSSHEARGLEITFIKTIDVIRADKFSVVPPFQVFLTDEVGNRLPPGSTAYQASRPVLISLVSYIQDPIDESYLGTASDMYKEFSGTFQAFLGGGGLHDVTFSDLTFNSPRAGNVTLSASSAGLLSSNVSLKIISGDATSLVFLQQPHETIERFSGNIVRNNSDDLFSTTSEPLVGLVDFAGSLVQSPLATYIIKYTVTPFAGDVGLSDVFFSLKLNSRSATEKLPSNHLSKLLKNALNRIDYTILITCENTSNPNIRKAESSKLRIENCPRGSFPPPSLLGCNHCPEGGICDGTEIIVTKSGYWKSPNATTTYYSCPVGCKQGNQCIQGRKGVACASCDIGWTHNGNTCSECFPLVPLIICLLLFLVVMCFLFVVWILFLALPLTSGRAFSKTINPLHGILFSSMFYLQTDGMIGELLLPTEWLKTLLLWQYRLTTGDVLSVTFYIMSSSSNAGHRKRAIHSSVLLYGYADNCCGVYKCSGGGNET